MEPNSSSEADLKSRANELKSFFEQKQLPGFAVFASVITENPLHRIASATRINVFYSDGRSGVMGSPLDYLQNVKDNFERFSRDELAEIEIALVSIVIASTSPTKPYTDPVKDDGSIDEAYFEALLAQVQGEKVVH